MQSNILVGYTGFVGQTLAKTIDFEYKFNSKNLADISEVPEGCDLYLSCLPATKWMVNKNLKEDMLNISRILEKVGAKSYKNVYLISTIDIYGSSPLHSDEDYAPNYEGMSYGSNRLLFEAMVKEYVCCEKLQIFRLPALFGEGLKKNVIFDLMNNNQVEKINLNTHFQWYDMADLARDLHTYTQDVVNLFPEPVYTKDIVDTLFPETGLTNMGNRMIYDFKTKHTDSGYIYDSAISLKKIKAFVQ